MPRARSRSTSAAQLQAWADNIPLGSLDQLQRANPGHNPSVVGQSDASSSFPSLQLVGYREPASVDSLTQLEDALVAPVRHVDSSVGDTSPRLHTVEDSVAKAPAHDASHPPSTDGTDVWSQARSQQAATVSSILASQVPLPSSQTVTGPQSVRSGAEASQVALPASRSSNIMDPSETAATTSEHSRTRRSRESGSVAIDMAREAPLKVQEYWTKVDRLEALLPQLDNILPHRGRHKKTGLVTCIDYFDDGHRRVDGPLTVKNILLERSLYKDFALLKAIKDDRITSRIILIEDLCPELIAAAGSVFAIDPEFFAEHLNQSGYDGVDYEDVNPARWAGSQMTKQYTSVTWFRPVRQNVKVTGWLKDPRSLLEKHEIMNGRVTKTVQGARVWSDPDYDIDGRPILEAMDHRAQVDTNIFRRTWSLSARPSSHNQQEGNMDAISKAIKRTRSRPAFVREPEPGLVPTAWEERASFYPYKGSSAPIGILLIDPLPSISDMQTSIHKRRAMNQGVRSNLDEFPNDEIHEITIALPMEPRLPIEMPINKFEATDDDITNFEHSLNTLQSTTQVVTTDMPDPKITTVDGLEAGPILALLRLIENDTLAFFRCLQYTLDDISQDSLDDFLMARRLSEWRGLMSDFEIAVPATGKRLEAFVDAIFCPDDNHRLPKEVEQIMTRINKEIDRVRERLEAAYAGLRADMQFTESRRSITETKTVTRLTELAFIFIPLSFCASLFSMEIHELQNGAPVWAFIVTALVMVSLAYAVRLFISSELLVNSTRRSLERFWESRGGSRSESAPVLTLAWYTIQELWSRGGNALLVRGAGVLFLAAFPLVPIITMWLYTGMGAGFHTAITFVIIVIPMLGTGVWILLMRFQSGRDTYDDVEEV